MNPTYRLAKTVATFALNVAQNFLVAGVLVYLTSVMILSGNGNISALVVGFGVLLVVRDAVTGRFDTDLPLHDLVLNSVTTAKTKGISVRQIARAEDLSRLDVQEILENMIADGDVEACGTDPKAGVLYRLTTK